MKKTHLLIVISLFLLYAISNYFWLSQNKLPVSYDEGVHLWTSLRFVRAFIHPGHNIFYELLHADTTNWPPLGYFIAGLVNLIFGTSYITSVMTNMLFFFLLILSLYLIGKRIHGPTVGILAVFTLSLYPIIYGHSRLFQLDLALTSIVTFSIYCLISTEGFKNRKWSVIFGIVAGLGMLTKIAYGIFILPLWVYTVIACLRSAKRKEIFYAIRNFSISLGICLFISLPWYLLNIKKLVFLLGYIPVRKTVFVLTHLPTAVTKTHVFHPAGATELFLKFNNIILSPLFLTVFVVSLIIFYTRKKQAFTSFITVWCLVAVAVLTFGNWKQPRFFMPVLPGFALISAIGLESLLRIRWIGKAAVYLIFAIALVQYFNTSFNPRLAAKSGSYDIAGSAPPRKTDWKHEDIAKSFFEHKEELKGYPFLTGIITNEGDQREIKPLFGNRVMNYYLMRQFISSNIDLGAEISLDLQNPKKDIHWFRENNIFMEKIADMTGLVYISQREVWPVLDGIENILKDQEIDKRLLNLINKKEGFNPIDRIALPEGYYANIYLYKIPEIKKDDLSIRIFNGKIKIFYQDRELTKNTGMIFDFIYEGKTYKFKDMVWNFYSPSPYTVKLVCDLTKPQVRQTIFITADKAKRNTIGISVNLESQDGIMLDLWYANTLLSDSYRGWIRPFSKRTFKGISMFFNPDSFESLDSDYRGPNVVGIQENTRKGLPAILFRSLETQTPMRAGVSNTNYYHNARCVYLAADSGFVLEPGISKDILKLEISIMDGPELRSAISDIERKGF